MNLSGESLQTPPRRRCCRQAQGWLTCLPCILGPSPCAGCHVTPITVGAHKSPVTAMTFNAATSGGSALLPCLLALPAWSHFKPHAVPSF